MPTFLIAAFLLTFFIVRVVRVVSRAHLLSVPVREQQEVTIAQAGTVVLCTQSPLLSTRFARLTFELAMENGVALESRKSWFHARSSGMKWVRREEQRYEVPFGGRYLLRVHGLDPARLPDENHQIVLMRPHLTRSIGCVLGILLSSGLLTGSLVLFGLSLTGRSPSPPQEQRGTV